MLTYYDVIRNAMRIYYEREKYCYFYAAKGQVLTNELMDALIACEPEYWKKYQRQIPEIKRYSLGKIGLDCSGFINACTGEENYSTGYYMDTLNKTTPKLGTEGNLLYTTFGGTGRHVGLDIGYGFCLSFDRPLHSCEFNRIAEYQWETSGQIKNIDYTGAKN